MKLTSINEVKNLMGEFGVTFNKGYGQNFLINDAIPVRIAEECGAGTDDGILEIGPGIGTMTVELASRYKKVVAVEIDTRLIPILSRTTADFDNVTVINADIMKTDLRALFAGHFSGMNVSVCANLPYYITSPIIMGLLESGLPLKNITVMVQKEVAERLCSKPGDGDYGALTAAVNRYGEVKRLFGVSAGSFLPPPKVDSAVIRITLDETKKYKVFDEKYMTRVIKGAFAQRRKNLCNSICTEFPSIPKSEIASILSSLGYETGVRGETLGINDFAKIADAFYNYENKQK